MIALEEGPVGSVRVGGLLGKFFLTLKEITNFTYVARGVERDALSLLFVVTDWLHRISLFSFVYVWCM